LEDGLAGFGVAFVRTCVAVERFHLDRHLDEQVFRYNDPATKYNPLNDADGFAPVMSQVRGKGLTYAQLTGDRLPAPLAVEGARRVPGSGVAGSPEFKGL
jgi:hypothetical protein